MPRPKKIKAPPHVAPDYPVVVIAVDPGVTTGVCDMLFTEDSVELLATDQWDEPDEVWKFLRQRLYKYKKAGYNVVLVVEQFDKRPGVVNPDFTPKYINRDIEINLADYNIKWQIPAAAMNLVKPARRGGNLDGLKRFGWYKLKSVHSNDATRHAIVYGVETLCHMPLILKGWPKPKEDNE